MKQVIQIKCHGQYAAPFLPGAWPGQKSTITQITVWVKKSNIIHYFIWRVMVGFQKKITLLFLIIGHTKFSPDWCFGLLKQRFRCCKIACLADLEQVVHESAEANVPQLLVTQDGDVIMPTYNWTSLVAGHLYKLKNINKCQHVTFAASQPGNVCVKLQSDGKDDHISVIINSSCQPSV